MRRLTVVGALVVTVAVLSGCWAHALIKPPPPLMPDPSSMVRRTPGPSLSPWPAANVLVVQLNGLGPDRLTPDQLAAATSVIGRRLAGLGVDAMVTPLPDDRLRVDVADGTPRGTVGRVVTSDADLEFMAVPNRRKHAVPDASAWPRLRGTDVVRLFGSEAVTAARPGTTPDGRPAMDIDVRPDAVRSIRAFADTYPGWGLSIYVEGGPTSKRPIDGTTFEGHALIPVPYDISSPEEMIAILIDGGTLPVEASVYEECPDQDACSGVEYGAQRSPVASAATESPWDAQAIVIVQLGGLGGASPTADQIAATVSVIEARLARLGVAASMTPIPDDRLRIELTDPGSRDAVGRVATARGDLQFVPVPEAFAGAIVDGEALPPGMPVEPLFGGTSVESFEVSADQMGQPAVDLQLDAEAAGIFDDWAAQHIGDRFAMVLDGIVIAAPVVRAAEFNGRVQISGGFDMPRATEMAAILGGGVLPVSAQVLTVCPATTEDCLPSSPTPSVQPAG